MPGNFSESFKKKKDAKAELGKRVSLIAEGRYLVSGCKKGLKWSQLRNGLIYLLENKTSESRQIPTNETLEKMFKGIKIEQDFKNKSNYIFTCAANEDRLIGEQPVRARKKLAPVPEKISA